MEGSRALIWSFNYCKKVNLPLAKSGPKKAGDVWTWTPIDADSKLIVSYLVGDRDGAHALEFVGDLAERLVDRPQGVCTPQTGIVARFGLEAY